MKAGLIEINLQFTNRLRPEFDARPLIETLRKARATKGLTLRQIADLCGVTQTEAEHWFRLDRFGSPPSIEAWPKVKALFGIEGWDIVGESYEAPNTYDMSGRGYYEGGLAPTITVRTAAWVVRGAE